MTTTPTSTHSLRLILVAGLACFAIACVTSLSAAGAALVDSDGRGLEHCKFVGDFYGSSPFVAYRLKEGILDAKNQARNEAAEAGATHVVWGDVSSAQFTAISAKAYSCP